MIYSHIFLIPFWIDNCFHLFNLFILYLIRYGYCKIWWMIIIDEYQYLHPPLWGIYYVTFWWGCNGIVNCWYVRFWMLSCYKHSNLNANHTVFLMVMIMTMATIMKKMMMTTMMTKKEKIVIVCGEGWNACSRSIQSTLT